MSEHYFDIKFRTLGQLSSKIGVILCVLPLDFAQFFSFISNVFIRNNQIRFLL